MKQRIIHCVLSVVGLCAIAGCASRRPANILFVMIDTLRADRLGCYGNNRGLTPFLDSLAERGYVFRTTYAQSSWTNPSVASVLTSRFQSQHGIISFASVLAEGEVTLPELLQARGYVTGGFSANELIARKNGFAQGYDEYRATLPTPGAGPSMLWVPMRSQVINEQGLSWLDALPQQQEAPVFLYLHYMEPHIPYAPPDALLGRVFAGRERPDVSRVNESFLLGNLVPVEDEMLLAIQDVYDVEVMSLDADLRVLFTALESRRFLDNTIVVITADHGEEFMDHGFMGHDKTLYNEVLQVPFILIVPGQSARVDIEDPVSLVDIAPTLLDLLGIPPPPSFEGRSLKGLMPPEHEGWLDRLRRRLQPRERGRRPAFSELIKEEAKNEQRLTPHERAVVLGSRKLIAGIGGGTEFYDLAADVGERDPTGVSAEDRTALQTALDEFRQRTAQNVAPRATQPLDAEAKERLRALGYAD